MSKLEVDKVTPQSGTTLTIGEAGDTTVINGLGTLPATIGSATQVLSVNAGATGLEYGTAATDLSNLNATNLTSGTIPDGRFPSILPAAGGQNLTSLQPAAIVGGTFGAINAQNLTNIPGEISWQSTIITTNSTIVASRGYWINTTSGAVTITLPASASVGDRIILTDYLRTWGTNALTINPNSLKFQGGTTNPIYNTSGQSVDLVYSGATQGWIPNSDDNVSDESIIPYTADFLIIAGGGGGGHNYGGGGGAGGYRASFNSETSGGGGSSESATALTIGTVYTITVGGGGAMSSYQSQAASGINSSISGTGLTTITSVGGGGAGGNLNNGIVGGSGGAGGSDGTGASGTANQGYAGGNGMAGSGNGGGGGGGAGAIGATTSTRDGGNGGNGVASTITGSSVTRTGGGGGGDWSATSGTGGSGGGGNGGAQAAGAATAGATNTGSGGGGGDGSGNGGSGVVILRMATSDYSGTTSGSPTISTSGSDTILVYNSSGSYTG